MIRLNRHRAYRIDRDADGMPFRMVWQGDYQRVSVVYLTCPRCPNAPKLVSGRCLSCWGDWSHETEWVRA